jgi:hypothetical protein
MKQQQYLFTNGRWNTALPESPNSDLLLAFGGYPLMADPTLRADIPRAFPNAEIIGCTTSGEIVNTTIYDDSLCLTAITWEKTRMVVKSLNVKQKNDSHQAGIELGKMMPREDLKYALLIANGSINGTQLVNGLKQGLPENTLLTGGMAGDGDRFESTWVWHNDKLEQDLIVLCGLYGDDIQVGYGCVGGWEPFGPMRRVSHAEGNILYKLDGEPALDLYKKYLGDHAKNLPASALLFPLYLQQRSDAPGAVRTILQINEEDGSMVFAGDMEEGKYAKLMRSNNDRLISGAETAAENCLEFTPPSGASLGLLISCVGRRLVLKQRTEEELESIRDILGDESTLCGFYSYGEISRQSAEADCMVHNQTITLTVFSEDA